MNLDEVNISDKTLFTLTFFLWGTEIGALVVLFTPKHRSSYIFAMVNVNVNVYLFIKILKYNYFYMNNGIINVTIT